MQYKLENNSPNGILIDRTPILQDVRNTYTVSFLLPDCGFYVALLRDANGVEYRKTVVNGKLKLPKELLKKEQYIELTLCQIDGDRILNSWLCEPLKITAFFYLRRTQWQVSGGMTDKDCYARLIQIEETHTKTLNEFIEFKETVNNNSSNFEQAFCIQMQKYDELAAQLAALTDKYNNAVAQYNTAVETINKMNERLAALEVNYDPTII